jgi:hypothetical protein
MIESGLAGLFPGVYTGSNVARGGVPSTRAK